MSLVRNERTKITATYLNGLAVGVLAIGGLAPLINAANTQTAVTFPIVISASICIFVSIALHLFARRVLKGLQP